MRMAMFMKWSRARTLTLSFARTREQARASMQADTLVCLIVYIITYDNRQGKPKKTMKITNKQQI